MTRCASLSSCLALALLIGGCSAGESANVSAEEQPARVSVLRLGETNGQRAVTATGTVRLRRETPLAFLNDGRVATVSVREGDRVRAGQLLAALDATAIDATVMSAAAETRRSSAELARQKQLFRQGWVAKSRVETADSAAVSASAGYDAARFNQRFSAISAPAGGVILARLAEPGQTLASGTPVVVLGEFASGFVLRVPLSASDVAGVRRGQTASVAFSDGAAPPMAATVIEIAGRSDARTGTFQVEFALPASAALRSGMIGQVVVLQDGPQAGISAPLLVPASALFAARADEGFVWRYDPSSKTVSARMVKLGAVSDRGVAVLSGLSKGDIVVRAGVDRLVEGQRVVPVADGPAKAKL